MSQNLFSRLFSSRKTDGGLSESPAPRSTSAQLSVKKSLSTAFSSDEAFSEAVTGDEGRDGEKTCPRCGRDLPVAAFAIDRSKASGRKSHCKACDRERHRTKPQRLFERVVRREEPPPEPRQEPQRDELVFRPAWWVSRERDPHGGHAFTNRSDTFAHSLRGLTPDDVRRDAS
jgi:hypothetical protein